MPASAFPVALGVAVLAAAALIGASLLGAGGNAAREPAASAAAPVTMFAGIRQSGLTLGAAAAPVTLIEYADLQCPYCALWATDVLPAILREYVRKGRVRLVFHGLAFLGPDSETALRATLAAGRQNRLWSFMHALYERQRAENSGWVEPELPAAARRAAVDLDRISLDARSVSVEGQITAAGLAAQRAGVRGTPAFELGRTGEPLRLVTDGSLESLRSRLNALLEK